MFFILVSECCIVNLATLFYYKCSRMKFFLTILLFTFLTSGAHAQQPKGRHYEGLYGYGKNIEKGGIGNLAIHWESDSTLLFHLDVNRGAPSYNSGETYGRIRLYGDSGTYHFSDTSGLYHCGLIFLFATSKVVIKYMQGDDSTLEMECGYGFNVYAGGNYFLRARKKINSFTTGEGSSIPFNAQTVDEWEKKSY